MFLLLKNFAMVASAVKGSTLTLNDTGLMVAICRYTKDHRTLGIDYIFTYQDLAAADNPLKLFGSIISTLDRKITAEEFRGRPEIIGTVETDTARRCRG